MIRVREASFEDFEAINDLGRRHGLEARKNTEWESLWKENPVMEDLKRPWPLGWVLEGDMERIIGCLCNVPLAYELEGRRLTAAAGTFLAVDADYRNYSILLIKRFFEQKNVDLLLLTTANNDAGRIFPVFKARRIPVDSYATVLFWIINYRQFVSSALINRKIPFKGALAHPLSLTLRGIDKLTGRNQRMFRLDGEIQQCETFDGRFDAFWSILKKRYSDRLLYVRDREHLGWHFKSAIKGKRVWVFVCGKESRINSYAIFLRQDADGGRLRRIRLVDFQYVDDGTDAIMKMISHAAKRCRKEDIHVLEIIGFDSEKRSAAEEYSPYKRMLPSWPFFYKANDPVLADRLNAPGRWDPCMLDGDGSL